MSPREGLSYWQKQEQGKPLFPDIEWSKPERADQAGKLVIIGGNKLGFTAVAESYQTALETGVHHVRVVLPDALKKVVPASLTDVLYAPSNPSGSLSGEAIDELRAAADWASSMLFIGDAGRNSETAILYEKFFSEYKGLITLTRDAIDLIKNNPSLISERENTLIVASFAQLQKLFQELYYPKILAFSMQLLQLVEALHKFTVTYPCSVITLHSDHLVIASKGEVVTQKWQNPMAIWRGEIATKAACYWLWHPNEALKSISTSVVN